MDGDRSVAVVTTNLAAGGAEKQAVLIANGLAEVASVCLVTLTDNDFLRDRVDTRIELHSFSLTSVSEFVRNPAKLYACSKWFRSRSPDAVLSLNYPAQLLVSASELTGLQTRHVISERQEELGSRARRTLRHLMYSRCYAVTANTAATAASIGRAGLAPPEGVRVIRNIVDQPTERHVARDPEVFEWIAIGRLAPQKDLRTLMQALAVLRGFPTVGGFHMTVVGTGPELEALKSQVRSLGLSGIVDFVGQRQDAMDLLVRSDGLVLSSLWEGMPNAVLEAAVRGVPIVSTDVGGVREALPESCSDFIVQAGDPTALAAAMRQLMALQAPGRAKLGASELAYVTTEFNQQKVIDEWCEILVSR